jgi:hypothetical protein
LRLPIIDVCAKFEEELRGAKNPVNCPTTTRWFAQACLNDRSGSKWPFAEPSGDDRCLRILASATGVSNDRNPPHPCTVDWVLTLGIVVAIR